MIKRAHARRHKEVKVLPVAGYKRGRKKTGHTFVPELKQVLEAGRTMSSPRMKMVQTHIYRPVSKDGAEGPEQKV